GDESIRRSQFARDRRKKISSLPGRQAGTGSVSPATVERFHRGDAESGLRACAVDPASYLNFRGGQKQNSFSAEAAAQRRQELEPRASRACCPNQPARPSGTG